MTIIIIPSIDLMEGKAVALRKGMKALEIKDLDKAMNKFRVFPETNVIDLDSAFCKKGNKELVKRICKKIKCNVGGGIRSAENARELLRAGAKNVIIGTNANPEFLKQLPSHRVIVALDVKSSRIVADGRRRPVAGNLKAKIRQLEKYCGGFLVTDADAEGSGSGCNLDSIKKLKGITKKRIIIAGGISSYAEIKEINGLGFDQVLGLSVHNGTIDPYTALIKILKFSNGLIPTIVQDNEGQILMLAYSSKESILKSLSTRQATYFSRSRNRLWTKGESSGNRQELLTIKYDCDFDALVYVVKQTGSACHTSRYSCFEDKNFGLDYLLGFLREHIDSRDPKSYTCKMAREPEGLKKKILEEAREVVSASSKGDKISEISDLLYFVLVFMAKNKISLDEIKNELSLRHKK